MKKRLIIIGFVAAIGWLGCGKKGTSEPTLPSPHPVAVQRSLSTIHVAERVRKLVDSDEVIDLDLSRVNSPSSKLSDEDYAEMKAAIYRFYKNVKLENGQYVYIGTGGAKGAKLSDHLFEAYMKSLDKGNKFLETAKLRGDSITLTPINDTYLNSLLN